jgi:hypothetical protein
MVHILEGARSFSPQRAHLRADLIAGLGLPAIGKTETVRNALLAQDSRKPGESLKGKKGGDAYCRRYRPAARMAQPIDTSICHLGFRCIIRVNR